MSSNEDLYEGAFRITQSNIALYDRWESHIAAYMTQRWPAAFEKAAIMTGADRPTVIEAVENGADHIDSHKEFLSDLYEVFRVLAKGCPLDINGNWC